MEREYRIMDTCEGHPNIVQAIEYIPEKEKCRGYLVMEKVDGEHLLDLIMQKGAMSEDEAKAIFRKILDSLNFLHEKKIVHRDLNPTNIFLTQSGEVKILDFNVSKIISS
jgi:serine/threonine protein kinase